MSVQVLGDFQNMDFEAANLSGYTSAIGSPIPVSDALPGWNAYYDGVSASAVWHNTASLGSGVIAINDAEYLYGFVPLEGVYSVGLQGFGGTASIGQSGFVPRDSLSVVFLFRGENVGKFEVSFQGQVLPCGAIRSEPTYSVYAADISRFAGHPGELRFTESNYGRAIIDDIHFSSQAVPEPASAALLAMGALALASRFVRRKS
jgi:hypothetical protein